MRTKRPIPWPKNDLKDPTCDLCLKRPEGYWDIVHRVDGWAIYSPIHLEGSHFAAGTDRFCLVVGDVSRDEAQAVAEKAIMTIIKK